MKKTICCMVSLLIVFLAVLPSVHAAEENWDSVVYFEDGSYISIKIEEYSGRAAGSKSGTKTYNYYDSGNNLDWKAVLSGSFTYTGNTAICNTSSCSVTIYDSSLYTVSKENGKSGGSATGSVTMARKVLGITVEQQPVNMKLTCDANGNLS